jgi:diguanylate cyclase (GGDEF)-like protein/PAS domain S-box-containing protein
MIDGGNPRSAHIADNPVGEGLSERLLFLLSESDFGTWDLGVRTGEVVVDQRWAEIIGYTLAELEPMTFEKFASMVHPDDWERTQASVTEQISGSDVPFDFIFRMRHKQGSWRWIRSRGKITKSASNGDPLSLTGINEDITDARHRDLELVVSRQQLQSAQRIAGVGSWFLDLATDEVTWSEELYLMQDLDPNELPPPAATHAQLFDDESWERLSQALTAVREEGTPYELELRMERAGKFFGWMLVRGEAVRDSEGTIMGIQGVALDISDRKRTESSLQRQAAHDSLTGLGNRSAMNQEMENVLASALRRGAYVGCLMIDIDDFKFINDNFGHAVGDAVLREAANRLTETTRGSDSVFRLGGDEFIILLPNVATHIIAEEVAARILAACHEPMLIEGQLIHCTVSIGGAISDGTGSVSELLRDADNAMYAAKQQGRDKYVFFDQRQQMALVERLSQESQMREGIGTDQFIVHYQPIVDLNSGIILEAEALLRWCQPSGAILDAKDFMRVAEETGLMRELGAFSLREACMTGAGWVGKGLRGIHVNISSSQLAEPNFLNILDDALSSSGMDAHALCLEVTESTLLRETNIVRTNVKGIYERRVRLALDDFGTGYAALSYLSELPISALKIDRIFVRSAARGQSDSRVLKGSLVLAHALEMESIAEGIENQGELEQLRELGCQLGQGNYLSPPINAQDFTALLQSRNSFLS